MEHDNWTTVNINNHDASQSINKINQQNNEEQFKNVSGVKDSTHEIILNQLGIICNRLDTIESKLATEDISKLHNHHQNTTSEMLLSISIDASDVLYKIRFMCKTAKISYHGVNHKFSLFNTNPDLVCDNCEFLNISDANIECTCFGHIDKYIIDEIYEILDYVLIKTSLHTLTQKIELMVSTKKHMDKLWLIKKIIDQITSMYHIENCDRMYCNNYYCTNNIRKCCGHIKYSYINNIMRIIDEY
jgi:hypothetical protein